MTSPEANGTEQVARRYFDAWTSGDTATAASLLAPEFRFTAGDMTIEGREAFLDAGAFPSDATVSLESEAYRDSVGFQMYRANRGPMSVRIVERLVIRDGQIVSSDFITDMGAFMAFSAESNG